MSKSNKEKRKAKKRKKALRSKSAVNSKSNEQCIGPVLAQFKSPWIGISDEQREKLVDKMGFESKKEFEVSLNKLREIIKTYEPINILAIVSGYTLTVGAGSQGIKSNEKPDSTHQFHVEILQALILQIADDEQGDEFAHPRIIQDVLDELKVLGRTFSFSRMSSDVMKLSDEERAIQKVQENIRSYGNPPEK